MNRSIVTTVSARRPRRRARRKVVTTRTVVAPVSRRTRRGRRKRGNRRRSLMGLPPATGGEYLRSLLEPERYTSRIPDMNGWNTAVFQDVIDVAVPTGTDGSLTALFYPTPITPSTANLYPNLFSNATQIAAQGVWTLTGSTQQFLPGSSSTIQNAFSMVRPVSGVLLAEFIGTTSNDQGEIAACPIFRGETAKASFTSVVQNSFCVAAPLRNGIRFLWKPMDEIDHQFNGTNAADVPGLYYPGGIGAPTGVPFPSVPGVTLANGPGPTQTCAGIQIMVAGAVASTQVLRLRWIVNYEGVPNLSTIALFEVKKEAANPSALATAMNVIGSVPWGDVWQGVAGIGGAMLEQAVGSQLPNYLGGLAANGVSQLIANRIGMGRRRYPAIDLSVD